MYLNSFVNYKFSFTLFILTTLPDYLLYADLVENVGGIV